MKTWCVWIQFRDPYWNWTSSFLESWKGDMWMEVVWTINGSCFLGQLVAMCPGFPQYIHNLFTHHHCLFCSMSGLNHVWSICMGSSFDVNVVDGEDIIGAKFFGIIGDSQHFSYQHSNFFITMNNFQNC